MYSISIGPLYAVVDISIKRQLKDLNLATGTMVINSGLPAADSTATIRYIPTGEIVMVGILKSLKETNPKQYRFEIIERAYELYDSYINSAGNYVVNVPNGTSVNNIVDNYILNGSPGWTRDASSYDNTSMPPLQFNYASRLGALTSVLKERRGHMMWFDSINRKVSFGPYRPGSTHNLTTYIRIKTETDSLKRKVTKIIVLGKTDSIKAEAGYGSKLLVYRYADAATVEDAQLVANTLLAQSGITRQRITVDVAPSIQYQEGDRVILNGTTYLVTDVDLRMDKTILGLVSGEVTLLDLLGGRIQLVQGGTFAGVESTWEGGSQNIGFAAPGRYVMYIGDKSKIDDYMLRVKLLKYVKPALTRSTNPNVSAGNAVTGASAALHTTGLDALLALTNNYNLGNLVSLSNQNQVPYGILDAHNDGFRPGGGAPLYIPYGAEDNVTKDPGSGRDYFDIWSYVLPTADYEFILVTFSAVMFIDDMQTTGNFFWQVRELYNGVWWAVSSWQRGYLEWTTEHMTALSGTILTAGRPECRNNSVRYFRIYCEPDAGAMWVERIFVHGTGVSTHSHGILQSSHAHTIQDPTHDHNLSDPSHVHGLNEGGGHSTPVTNPYHSHEGAGVDNPYAIDSYPTNIEVIIRNSSYPGAIVLTHAGGSEMELQVDITPYLVTGKNEIEINTNTAGNVYLNGNYIAYG